ncbi:hypothetical protein HDU98_008788 [Podochytrium sp. JEL0797]|nr:hypothetical protein HDU98_008788 [Podochytrium sp. JEL0797]
MDALDALVASSSALTAHILGGEGLDMQTKVVRGLGQIDAQTQRLAAKDGGVQGQQAPHHAANATQTAFLLASRGKGFDADRAQGRIDALLVSTASASLGVDKSSSVPVEDLDAFLLVTHQSVISQAIDAARIASQHDCKRRLDDKTQKEWAKVKRRVFGELSAAAVDVSATPFRMPHISSSSRKPALGATQPATPATPSSSSSSTSSSMSLQMLAKNKAYATAVASLTHAPNKDALPVFADVARRLERAAGASSSAAHLAKCWALLMDMFGSHTHTEDDDDMRRSFSPVAMHQDIQRDQKCENFSHVYRLLAETGGDAKDEAVLFRRRVVQGGKKFLQDLYFQFIQHLIHLNRIPIGGMPTVHTYINAYIHLKFTKNNNWNAQANLEIHHGVAVWAHLWYLLRCGLLAEAREYVCGSGEASGAQREVFGKVGGVGRFEGWVKGFVEKGKVEGKMRLEVLEEWNTRVRPYLAGDAAGGSGGKVDPFKVAVLKVLGRCDMASKVVKSADVAPSVEDYLWVQLMLVQEETQLEKSSSGGGSALNNQDRYTLKDMSRNMQKFGANHFNPQNRTPHVYFLVLLLCGEFERAVAFLYNTNGAGTNDLLSGGLSLDAIHFAIALSQRGLLRVPENPRGFEGGSAGDVLVTRDGGEVAYFLLGKVVYGYARLFFKSDPVDALCYLLVLGPYGGVLEEEEMDVGGVEKQAARDYSRLLYGHMKELVLDNCGKNAGALLGQSATMSKDAVGRVPGELEKVMGVAHLTSYSDLVKRVLGPAAREAESRGRLADAVKLFDYAQEYNVVVDILCKQLSEAFVAGAMASGGGSATGAGSGGLSSLFASSGSYTPSPGAMSGSGVSVVSAASSAGKQQQQPLLPIVVQAQQTVETYKSRPTTHLAQITPSKLATLETLLLLHKFLGVYQSDASFPESMRLLKETKLLPLSNDMQQAQLRLENEFTKLDDAIAKCIPGLLLCTMGMFVRVYQGAKGEMGKLVKADCQTCGRSVLLYAGNIQYRIPSDVFARLNRWESLMMQQG